jgi:Ca-activated chloride channel family protein
MREGQGKWWLLLLVLLSPMLMGFAFPGSVQRLWRQADRAFKRQRYDEAARLYGEAGRDEPQQWALKYNQAVAAAQAKQYERAIQGLGEVAKEGPPELKAQAEFNIGNAYLEQGENEQAIEHYKKALYLRPDDLNAKWNLELARRKQQQEQQQQQQNKAPEQKQQPPQSPPPPQPDNQAQNQPQQQPPPPSQMPADEAQRLLQSLGQQDRDLQKQLQQQRFNKGERVPPGKDW